MRSPQQIQRWNRIIQAVYKFADKVNSEIPFLTKNSDKACLSFQVRGPVVFKQIQHLPEIRTSKYIDWIEALHHQTNPLEKAKQ